MPKSHEHGGPAGGGGSVPLAAECSSPARALASEFEALLGVKWTLPEDLRTAADCLLDRCGSSCSKSRTERANAIVPIISRKLRLNRERLQRLWNRAAEYRHYFSPAAKSKVAEMFDCRKQTEFSNWVRQCGLPEDLVQCFRPADLGQAVDALHQQLTRARINRSDARQGVQQERREALLRSLYGGWIYSAVDTQRARSVFSRVKKNELPEKYIDLLGRNHRSILTRECGAVVIRVPGNWMPSYGLNAVRECTLGLLRTTYEQLSNHSYCGIVFEFPSDASLQGRTWELISSATLFAERMYSETLKKKFYRPEAIARDTGMHIRTLNVDGARFEFFQFGFAFRDCIVICRRPLQREGDDSSISRVLLLLEKNKADERRIPCPACWSLDVRGNSYSTLGVRSWECQNPLCPERSAFDRGNRFSALSILRNEAANDENALIPESSLREWKLDVVSCKEREGVLDMFLRHYSLPGDRVHCVNWETVPGRMHGRLLSKDAVLPARKGSTLRYRAFERSPFFSRFLEPGSVVAAQKAERMTGTPRWLTLYHGSCLSALRQLEERCVDGAVTSPPYYNAREYSRWPNLYAYLYDMKVAAEGVFRVLRPGAYYLFNIFDNFDNDNIMARSALGKRRLPLGAYMVVIFRKCGFELAGNIVWHKGEVEGKRNYNQGNRAPFFQLPLNTWEHILVLRKPGGEVPGMEFPGAIYRRPVVKWIRGRNRHGHSAPFPEALPALLCSKLRKGMRVLDPFAGSLTTAVVAKRFELNAVAMEVHRAYCELGLERIAGAANTLPFGSEGG